MARDVLRTKTFATEAANLTLRRGREAPDTRGEFHVALIEHVFAGDFALPAASSKRMRNR